MPVPNTGANTGALTPYSFVTTASNNAQSIKDSSGFLGTIISWNDAAAAEFLKFYDTAGTPNPATDTPVHVHPIPPSGGATENFGGDKLYFAHGIGLAVVLNKAVNDNTAVGAGDAVISFGFT